MEKVITGFWDGEPIWRYETAQEIFAREIDKAFNGKEVITL